MIIRNKKIYTKGMTLVELLVVLGIFLVVAGLTIFDYGSFRSTVSTQNLVDDIALTVRKAQSYAIGAKALNNDFTNGYGVHFTTHKNKIREAQIQLSDSRVEDRILGTSTLGGSNKSFILFTDIGDSASGIQGDRMYNYQSDSSDACGTAISYGNECTEVFTITSLDQISAIYLNDETQPISNDSFVDVTFLRPNPDAYFCYKSNLNPNPPCDRSTDISHIRVEVSNIQSTASQSKYTKIITIWNSGQISVTSRQEAGQSQQVQGGVRILDGGSLQDSEAVLEVER